MKVGMAPLALLSVGAGMLLLPGVTKVIDRFLDPAFSDSHLARHLPSTGSDWIGLAVGAAIALIGIGAAYYAYVARPGVTLDLRDRLRPLHDFLSHKWYFDELYDAVFVHPVETFGGFGRAVVESRIVQGLLVGGAAGVVRSGSALARSLQTGYLRAYVAL